MDQREAERSAWAWDTDMLTSDQVVRLLEREVTSRGSQRKLAREIGVSPTFLNDILRRKCEPTGKVLAYLRLERRVQYAHV